MDGWTALQCACAFGKLETVERLIKEGLDVNHRDVTGWTPLHHAVKNKTESLELVKILLEKGAKFDLKTFNKNQTPLALAVGRALLASDDELTGEQAQIENMSPAKATVTRLVKGSSLNEKQLIVRMLDEEGSIDKATPKGYLDREVHVRGTDRLFNFLEYFSQEQTG
ncbi:ankyrin repeat-containing domain protein [Aspergillus venezuelensis]